MRSRQRLLVGSDCPPLEALGDVDLAFDALVILIAGLILALLAASLAGPAVRSFARHAFAVDAQLLSWTVAPTISVGLALILALSTIYPVIIALRQDPIDILEARGG